MHSALVSRVRARRVLTILCFALVALFWGVLAVPAIAVPSGISFSRITPIDGTTLLVARTAADNPLDPPTFQLKADIYINNAGGSDQEVASVEFSYPGSGISDRTYTPMSFTDGVGSNFVMPAGDEGRVPVYDGLGRDLPTPLPSTVRIEVLFDGDPDPLVLQFSLAFRDNPIPLGAYFFPARASDLDAGQFWIFRTRHTVDAGGGGGTLNPSTRSQRYGLDMGVARWNGSGWTELVDGAPALEDRENSDYLIFGAPLYAMADGMIVSCYRGEMDHDPAPFEEIIFDNGSGNSLVVQHGNDLMLYAHMKFESIPSELCPMEEQNDGLSIPLDAGQQIGVVGNTGRSTNAHLHIHAVNVPPSAPDTVDGVPLQLLNIRALGDDTTVNNHGETPTLRPLHGMTLHRQSLILPNPCGFDVPASGFIEVSRHGIEAECYQDVVQHDRRRWLPPGVR